MTDLHVMMTSLQPRCVQGFARCATNSKSVEEDMIDLLEATEEAVNEEIVASLFDRLTDCVWTRVSIDKGDEAMRMAGIGYLARKAALNAPSKIVYSRNGVSIRTKVSVGGFLDLSETEYTVGDKKGGMRRALGRIRVCRFIIKRGEVVAEAKVYASERDHAIGRVSYTTLGRWEVSKDGTEMVYEELTRLEEGDENRRAEVPPVASRVHFRRDS